VQIGDEDQELVGRAARHHLGRERGTGDSRARVAQELVALARAEAVVHESEAVEVDREDADRAAAALAPRHGQVQVVDELRLVGQAGDLVVVAVLEVGAEQRLREDPHREEKPAGDEGVRGMRDRPGGSDRQRDGEQLETEEAHPDPDREAVETGHQRDDGDRQPRQRGAARTAGDGDAHAERQLGHEPAGSRPVLRPVTAIQAAVEVDRGNRGANQYEKWPPPRIARGSGHHARQNHEHQRARSADAVDGRDQAFAVQLGGTHPGVIAHGCCIGTGEEMSPLTSGFAGPLGGIGRHGLEHSSRFRAARATGVALPETVARPLRAFR
jgi:hypothetical protein